MVKLNLVVSVQIATIIIAPQTGPTISDCLGGEPPYSALQHDRQATAATTVLSASTDG